MKRILCTLLLLSAVSAEAWTFGSNAKAAEQTAANQTAAGRALVAPSAMQLMQTLSRINPTAQALPVVGGTLSIDGKALGSWDLAVKGSSSISSGWSSSDWFTSTADSRCALVVVNGNLTIDSGEVFTPPARKLFTIVYVTGTLTVNGSVSMSQRGANHSATGSNLTAQDIKLALGTYSSVTDPYIPATGANGAAGKFNSTGQNANGIAGSSGASGSLAGGGSGGVYRQGTGTITSGAGAAGTSFSGGSGSGGLVSQNVDTIGADAGANGGVGGSGAGATYTGGGAGNPGGAGQGGGNPGGSGTGGTLIIYCTSYAGSGAVTSAGDSGGSSVANPYPTGGAGSGGGSITIFCTTNAGPTPTAAGGTGGYGYNGRNGGNGGNGSVRILLTP